MNFGKTVFDELGEDKFFPKKQVVVEPTVDKPQEVIEPTVAVQTLQEPVPVIEPETDAITLKALVKNMIAGNAGEHFHFKYSKGYLLKFGDLINANNLESVLLTAMSTGVSSNSTDLKHYVETLNYLMDFIGKEPYNPELFSSNSAKALGKFMAILHDVGRGAKDSAMSLHLGTRVFPADGSIDEIYKKMVLHVRGWTIIVPIYNPDSSENPLETL